jgi:hypothetical protein
MSRFISTNASGFVKDPFSRAVINTDDADYNRILLERERAKKLATLTSDVDNIKSELMDIKTLLLQIVNGRQNG